jgi:hypothetical protein
MIRFVTGICVIIAGVGAAEGTAALSTAILLATVGIGIMVWGLYGMAENGDLA